MKLPSLSCLALTFFSVLSFFLSFFLLAGKPQIMLNSKDESHKNVRKSWQSLFKSQLYDAKNNCSWYLFPVVKIIANSCPSETHGLSHGQKAKQEPCKLYKADHTDIDDYSLALPQKLFIFITASKEKTKMLINWITIIWPSMQTIWVAHLS